MCGRQLPEQRRVSYAANYHDTGKTILEQQGI
jgi:hypothetical protein